MNPQSHSLHRFIIEQDFWYSKALEEIQSGKKQNHWMWFIFPQVSLGLTPTSLFYSIQSLKEAEDYLKHPVLGKRLHELSELLLNSKSSSTLEIFGEVDSLKLCSCMTLFSLISSKKENIFQRVLDNYYAGERCENTIDVLIEWGIGPRKLVSKNDFKNLTK